MTMTGKRAFRRAALVGAALALASGGGVAAKAEQKHAHVHGAAKLNVAIEAGEIWLEIEAPAADIVGFEHIPETEADHAAVEAAAALLQDGESLYAFPEPAGCRQVEAEVASALMESGEGEGHDHAKADHDHAKAEHAHEKHDHGHAKAGHDHDKTALDHDEADHDHGHADFVARHRFRCEDPGQLVSVDLRLFEHFKSLEDVDATVISPTGQKAAELTPDRARLKF